MDFGISIAGNESCVDTVRALHQTILTLRTALEKSRDEISELKSKSWPDNASEDTIRNLSIENHVLRQKVVNIQPTKSQQSKSRDSRQRRVKRKESNDKIHITEKTPGIKEERGKSLESISDLRLLQLKDDRDKNQLTKSKTICFSNIIEGEKQISTTNSLHLKGTPQLNKERNLNRSNLGKVKRSKSKETVVKPNLLFTEEVFDDTLSVSRRGSILNFESEIGSSPLRLEELKRSRECSEKLRKLIKRKDKESEEKKSNKLKSKSPIKKREDTFIIQEENLTRRKSSLLGEQIEKVLIAQYSDKRNENEINDESGLNNTAKQDEGGKQSELEQQQPIEIIKCQEIVETIEKTETKEGGAETKADFDREIDSLETIEKTNETDVNKSETKEVDINNESTNKATNSDSNQDINLQILKNDSEQSSNDTLKSSETSTISSSQKNLEISVKIYKGSKKPIEIDIQTKKKHRTNKNSSKQHKMNNKSQNTSFDKDYVESSNEIRRHIDTAAANNIATNILQNDVEQEVDDIELIFTTDDTKETDFKEELVPIDGYGETQLLQCPLSDYDEKLSAETSDRELEDDVFNDNFENENQENCNFQSQTYDFRRENSQIYNSKSDNSINHEDKSFKSYYSYQDSSFENKSLEKDESFDRFEEKTRIIETDISKIGIQDVEYNMSRRNTCPNPIQYRPIMHREALGRGLGSRKCRPILAHSNVVRKESGVQTDISALPGSSWRSESSLGHKVKVGENFTTLPSKFPHPGSRLRLSEKTVEARRVLLSDIGFTSMVPELSRSADHLCPPMMRGPVVSSYGQFLRTTDLYSPAYTSQKFVWTNTPSEGSHSQSRYSSQYPLSSPQVPTRRCSAPVSPSKKAVVMKTTPSRVRFANGSLPELRGDWTATVDSGESTDSLVEEAEHFLRRSIDCLAPCKDICFRSENIKTSGLRRASAPEPSRDNVPPPGWQPFLPRLPRDLHLDYWVKVISPEGRVRGGRVRYVGPLVNQPEAFVGVQLSTPDGHSDGTYNSRRYFNCEPYHGLFVPFKKIIMGWRP